MNPMVYLFLALTTVLATTSNSAVLDINGDPMFGDDSYYVLPVIRGEGGGVTVSGHGGMPCPLDVVQESSEVHQGLPVKFSNWRPKIASVPESENLNIESIVGITICMQPTYWWINEFDELWQTWFLTASPDAEAREQKPLGFFQIKRAGTNVYKFVLFCPDNCMNVGIYTDERGFRRLGISYEPFLVQFKKANESEYSSKIMSVVPM